MEKIMLIISNKMNRKLLKEHLSQYYEILPFSKNSLTNYEIDLIITDYKNYLVYQKELKDLKLQSEPVFLPLLLLWSNKRDNIKSHPVNRPLENTDDFINKFELERRIKNILYIRQLSKQLSQRLDERETFLARLTENSPVGICVLQQGCIIYCNSAFSEILNRNASELYNCSISDIISFPSEIKQIIKEPQKNINNLSRQNSFEIKICTTKEDKWCEIKFSPITYNQTPSLLFTAIDITERKQKEKEIHYLSFCDRLTGLFNRAYLEKEMERLDVERQLPISIIMADLNGLKLVNDTYGHSAGDELLKKAAEILRNSLREEDIVARWGGDEFVVFLPQTTLDAAESVCSRIRYNSQITHFKNIPISIALGTAVKENKEEDMLDILKQAEDNMYKNKLMETQSAKSALLNTLLATLREKSSETEAHVERRQSYGLNIGKKIGLNDTELNRLKLLIMLHDIGKVNIPKEILTKEDPLTEEEWQIIKKHSEIGYRIACSSGEFSFVAEDILCHHERWDGKGYPQGLKKDEIPLLARIVAVVDAYKVMLNGRPYKKAMSKSEAIAELKRCAGTQFDPEIVSVFLKTLE